MNHIPNFPRLLSSVAALVLESPLVVQSTTHAVSSNPNPNNSAESVDETNRRKAGYICVHVMEQVHLDAFEYEEVGLQYIKAAAICLPVRTADEKNCGACIQMELMNETLVKESPDEIEAMCVQVDSSETEGSISVYKTVSMKIHTSATSSNLGHLSIKAAEILVIIPCNDAPICQTRFRGHCLSGTGISQTPDDVLRKIAQLKTS